MTKNVTWERVGSMGLITLDRQEALNALTPDMVFQLTMAFAEFAKDDRIFTVVMQGAGKAFCAGGDVRAIVEAAQAGDTQFAYDFWFEEYRLNRTIGRFAKPVVSLIGGVVMGGGVGLAMHGSHRVAGDRFLFAMPEVGIGFYPDVGGVHILNGLRGQLGRYLALTGARLNAADAYGAGLATHVVPTEKFEDVKQNLSEQRDVNEALAAHQTFPEHSALIAKMEQIDQLFGDENIEHVLANVRQAAIAGDEFAKGVDEIFDGLCPLSVKVADEAMRRMKGKTLEEVLVTDLRIAMRFVEGVNFSEGIRALLIDKDKSPKWQPQHWFEVNVDLIEPYFAPLYRDLSFA